MNFTLTFWEEIINGSWKIKIKHKDTREEFTFNDPLEAENFMVGYSDNCSSCATEIYHPFNEYNLYRYCDSCDSEYYKHGRILSRYEREYQNMGGR